LRGIGGAVGVGGVGAAGASGALGAIAHPASNAANSVASATERIVTRCEFARIDKGMAAMIESDSPGMDGVEF
jgi:hypothetical protein